MAEIEKELRHYLEGDVEPRAALEWSRETSAAMVDLKFCDLLGTWQHVTLPVGSFDESAFDEGLGFDGSSIRGWQGIEESDMMLMPDASTAILDPFTEVPTLSLLCEIAEPVTLEPYAKDPRRVARRAEEYLRSTGIADTCLRRPRVRVLRLRRGLVHERPERGALQGRLGRGSLELRRPRPRLHDPREAGLLPARAARHAARPAHAHGADARAARRRSASSTITRSRPAGQCEIDLRFQSLTRMADQVLLYKYVIKNDGARRRQVGDVHAEADLRRQRLGHALPPVAVEGGHAALRRQVRARRALAARARATSRGLLEHAPALLAFCAPTTNSYRRLVPGYEAPVNLAYSSRNRSACIRIPTYSESPKAKRIEFRCPTRPRTRTSRSRRC